MPDTDAKVQTREESLTAAFDAMESQTPENPEAAPAADAVPAPAGASAKEAASAAEKTRNADGTFAKAEPKPDEAKPGETPAQAARRKFPSSWKPTLTPKWDSLDEEIQAEIERREGDYLHGIKRYEDASRFARTMQEAINPFMATIQTLGVTPDVAVKHLLAADHALRYGTPAQKVHMMQQLFQTYGVDPSTLQADAPQIDPTVAALQQQIAQLQAQVQRSAQQNQEAALMPIVSEIDAFRQSQGHEHFNAVIEDMTILVQNGRAANLQEAYEMACWANPEVRKAMLEKERAGLEAKERERIAAAKAAASSVKGAPSNAPQTANPQDRRSAIEAAFGSHMR